MDRLEYLLSIRESNPKEIYDTWRSMGSLEVNSRTKMYIQNTLFKVRATQGPVRDALVYCINEYIVDENHEEIIWEDLTLDKTNTLCSLTQGITSQCFRVVLTMAEQLPINVDELPQDDLVLFNKSDDISKEYNITDLELSRILAEVGVPFIRIEELEYNRNQIISLCIIPAVQEYYSYFPIVEEEYLGNYGPGQEFLIPLPPQAFKGIVYYTLNNGSAGSNPGFSSAFSFMAEQAMIGGSYMGGSRYGRGVSYRNKITPGWTGIGMREANFMGRQLQQAWTNIMRKERTHNIIKDGKRYIHGFSTIGGALNVKWCKWSNNWDLIDFDDLKDVRRLCTAYVLRNLGMLRAQVKGDSPANIDYSLFNSRADTIENEVCGKWKESATNLRWTLERGSASL